MKIDRVKFTNLFTSVFSGVPARTPKDVLKNILCSCKDGTMTLAASDSEIHLKNEMPCDSGKVFCLLPAARVMSILKELTAETITLTGDSSKVRIVCGSADFELGCVDPEEFPPTPTFDADSYYLFNAAEKRSDQTNGIFD